MTSSARTCAAASFGSALLLGLKDIDRAAAR